MAETLGAIGFVLAVLAIWMCSGLFFLWEDYRRDKDLEKRITDIFDARRGDDDD